MKRQLAVRFNGRKRRGPRGAGRLYKRASDGSEHPADWTGSGAYWLAYQIPKENGTSERIRQALRDANGNPITDRDQAEADRKRILAPYQTGAAVETLKAIQARLSDAATQQAAAIEAANPPLQIADAWQAYVGSLNRPRSGAATLHRYELHWDRFTKWIGKVHPEAKCLCDVSRKIGLEYGRHLDQANYSPNTFNKHVRFLALLFDILAKHENARITMNPFGKDEITRRELETKSRREFTVAELTTILDAATGDLALLLYLGAATGLRLGDCCTLTWAHVDLAQELIQRAPRKTARRKPDMKVKLGIPPKLFDLLSSIPPAARTGYVLPDTAAKYLRDPSLITNRVQAHLLNCGIDVHAPGTGSHIQRKPDGTPKRTEDGSIIMEATGKPAVIEVGFHSLRHTWVSLHAARGTPGAIVQASVGHANPSMTAHYTHVDDDTARKVALALPVFASTTTPVTRDPLPAWARHLVESLTAKNVKPVKAELLKGGAE